MRNSIILLVTLLFFCSSVSFGQESDFSNAQAIKVTKTHVRSHVGALSESNETSGSSSGFAAKSASNSSNYGKAMMGGLDVSLAGAATYQIPFTLPPGISGNAPNIGLGYSSQSSNGIAGWGWNISGLSSITRTGTTLFHDGDVDPVDLDANDRFSLDGQRLIAKTGNYGANGTVYQTETYSNTKIIGYNGANESSSYFIVYNSDGTRMWYGNTSTAKNNFVWSLTKIEDVHGNTINFTYTKSSNNVLINEITYGTQTTTGINSIKFYYKTRNRKESSYLNGTLIELTKILNYIEIKGGNTKYRKYALGYQKTNLGYERINMITEENGAGQKLPPTYFNYEDTEDIITETGFDTQIFPGIDYKKHKIINGDFDGDGRGDLITYNTSSTKKLNIFTGFHDPNIISSNGSGNLQASSINVPNFNNIFVVNYIKPNNKLSDRQGVVMATRNRFNEMIFKTYRIDYRLGTLVPVYEYEKSWKIPSYVVDYNDGRGLRNPKNITSNVSANTSYEKAININASNTVSNGANIEYIASESVTLLPGFHSRYGTNASLRTSGYDQLAGTAKPMSYISGDFNGDGLTDVIAIQKTYTYFVCLDEREDDDGRCRDEVKVSDTSSDVYFIDLDTRKTTNFAKRSGVLRSEYNRFSTSKIITGDYNGDGKTDLYHVMNGKIQIYTFNSANNLVFLDEVANSAINLSFPLLQGDYNGDGITDFVRPTAENSSVWKFMIGTGTNIVFKDKDIEMIYNTPSQSPYAKWAFEGKEYPLCGKGPVNICNERAIFEFHYIPTDFNKDGKTDLIYHKIITPYASTDYSHQAIGIVANKGFTSNAPTMKFVDYFERNNDGVQKFGLPIFSDINSRVRGNEYAYISVNKVQSYNLLKDNQSDMTLNSITSNGLVTEIDYAELDDHLLNSGTSQQDIYRKGNSQQYPFVDIGYAPSFKLVKEVRQSASGIERKREYRYEGAVSHAKGLGFVGFSKTSRSNWQGDDIGTLWTTSAQDPQKRGVMTKQWTISNPYPQFQEPSSNFVSKTSYSYSPNLSTAKVFFNKLNATTSTDGLKGVTTITTFDYDQYNVLKSKTSTYPGGTNAMTYQTFNNPTPTNENYYIGRPKSEKTTTTLGSETFSTEEAYTYESNAIKTLKRKGHNTPWMTETFLHDTYGNVTQKTISATNMPSRTEKFEYFSGGRFIKKATNIENLETTYTYNGDKGYLLTKTNPYGQTTTFTYDAWDRLVTETDYLQNTITTTYNGNSDGSFKKIVTSSLGGGQEVYVNRWGWDTKTKTRNTTNEWISIEKEYDAIGRVKRESLPYKQSATQWTNNYYDAEGRMLSQTLPTGRIVSYTYNGLSVTVDDGIKTSSKTFDAVGNAKSATDPGGTINYTYYPTGAMKTTNYDGHIISSEIDGWGRKIELTDPSAGTYTYNYNIYGELLEETSPKGTTTYTYDNYGKISHKEITGDLTNLVLDYEYNTDSKLIKKIDGVDAIANKSYTYTYGYDTNKRPSTITETNNEAFYKREMYYNSTNGRMEREKYTSRSLLSGQESVVNVKSHFHAQSGAVYKITDADSQQLLWEINELNDLGQLTEVALGNGMLKKNTYNAYGLPENFEDKEDKASGRTALDIDYDFDDIRGNVLSRHNKAFRGVENFRYDTLDRLTEISGAITHTQSYDNSGRINVNSNIGTYQYQANSKYRIKEALLNPNGVQHYEEHAVQQITYNAFKKPVSIHEKDKGRVDFEYGPMMNRSVAHYGGTNSDKTQRDYTKLYSAISPVEIVHNNTDNSIKIITYVDGDAYTATTAHIKKNGSNAINEYHYLHRDHLGSILAISDSDANVVEQTHFGAWGTIEQHKQDGQTATFGYDTLLGRGYTGHEHFTSIGLIHMNGRMYDAHLGRFLSPDNFVSDPYDTQAFNRYGYVMNNPLRYNDPSGELPWLIVGLALVGAYTGGAIINQNLNPFEWDWKSGETWGWVLGGALLGAFAGATLPSGLSTLSLKFGVFANGGVLSIANITIAAKGITATALGLVSFGLGKNLFKGSENNSLNSGVVEDSNPLDEIENRPEAQWEIITGEMADGDLIAYWDDISYGEVRDNSEGNWLGYFQTGLDVVGLVPVFGEVADGINALIYVYQGDYLNAGLSAAAMIPLGGIAATIGKVGNKAYDLSKGAKLSSSGVNLGKHLTQLEKYGSEGYKTLQNGRIRYYGKATANRGDANSFRSVREWNPSTGGKRTWHETLNPDGKVIQVRPEFNTGVKTHYLFNGSGKYLGKW